MLVGLQGKDAAELRFDKKAYYVINKFWIFRGAIPSYIYEVEPVAEISYKGEVGAWVYRGDQIKNMQVNWWNKGYI